MAGGAKRRNVPQIKPEIETFAKIKVIGVGGGGGNAIGRMMACRIKGVNFAAVNTDVQDLHYSNAPEKIHIGKELTKGLGAGMHPEIGRQAAEENREEIRDALKKLDMVFITCGLGGGTGSGASPIIAEEAKDVGALTVAIVTKPFSWEGIQRTKIAEDSLEQLKEVVDTLITIPNDRILQVIDKKTSLINAFIVVDDVLRQGVQGISDLITAPGLINVDFADIKTVMEAGGPALMGIGRAIGNERAVEAAKTAINSPLLELSIDGAKGVLFCIGGGPDMGMVEVNEAAQIITESIDPDAKVIFGAVIDDKLRKGELKVTVIATGFEGEGSSASKLQLEKEETKSDLETEEKKENKDIFSAVSGPIDKKKKDSNTNLDSIEPPEKDEWDIPAFVRRKKKK